MIYACEGCAEQYSEAEARALPMRSWCYSSPPIPGRVCKTCESLNYWTIPAEPTEYEIAIRERDEARVERDDLARNLADAEASNARMRAGKALAPGHGFNSERKTERG